MKVREMMTHDVAVVRPEDSILTAARVMEAVQHGGLVVVDGDYHVIGLVSTADLLRFCLPDYVKSLGVATLLPEDFAPFYDLMHQAHEIPVSRVMRTNLQCVAEEASLVEVATRMILENIDRCPVVREGRLVGIISHGDLVHEIVHEGLRTVHGENEEEKRSTNP